MMYINRNIIESRSRIETVLRFLTLLIIIQVFESCDSIEVEEPNYELNNSTVFSEASTAEAAVTGIYIEMAQTTGFIGGGQQGIYSLTGLSSDELLNYSQLAEQGQFYANELLPKNSWNELYLWNLGYDYIYQANAVLEGLDGSTGLSTELKNRLQGEVLFLRALSYFYLVNLYGDVPLVTSTDYLVNVNLPRKEKADVYVLIESDLKQAIELLPEDYSFAMGERIRCNRWAATALLARVYLYTESWQNAEDYSSLVINQEGLYNILPDLNEVFLANSSEAILQLFPVQPNQNTLEGLNFILLSTPFNVSLTENLVDAFEEEDLRKLNWIDSISVMPDTYYYPNKYKVRSGLPVTEYSMVLRLAEQYLIRAEARLHLGKIPEASNDLNKIRSRAGLPDIELTGVGAQAALDSVVKERRLELFTEGGHRWLDLKRTNTATAVLGPLKPGWQATDVLYPIPQNEINNNPNLIQNPGY